LEEKDFRYSPDSDFKRLKGSLELHVLGKSKEIHIVTVSDQDGFQFLVTCEAGQVRPGALVEMEGTFGVCADLYIVESTPTGITLPNGITVHTTEAQNRSGAWDEMLTGD
jgi:hypothetical protein